MFLVLSGKPVGYCPLPAADPETDRAATSSLNPAFACPLDSFAPVAEEPDLYPVKLDSLAATPWPECSDCLAPDRFDEADAAPRRPFSEPPREDPDREALVADGD
jgi:hypothetical protein